ncbi:hypothetical protein [Thalassotalea sp. Y01]|uniref:hypothetical protein n=1 Tax=Thalassotalea sp. Y01 TaxID=2729613 RepID=UPI00145F76C7|nr:hypothetical protein [Thalassotalea sp. Y01]NMP16995.1 hypothetical protein [Thalassotalea sp. Y01]
MTILDHQVPVTNNLVYALQTHRLLWLLLCLTATLDYVSTINFMTTGGIQLEGNWVIRLLAQQFGIFSGVAFGKILQIFAAMAFCSLSKEMSRPILCIIIILNASAYYINIMY